MVKRCSIARRKPLNKKYSTVLTGEGIKLSLTPKQVLFFNSGHGAILMATLESMRGFKRHPKPIHSLLGNLIISLRNSALEIRWWNTLWEVCALRGL